MTLIDKVQSQIEKIYGIRVGELAENYLIGNQELLELLPAGQSTVVPKELFLVTPNPKDNVVEVALFLDAELRQNLANNNPLKRLSGSNISDFCTLIEGVSHFVYYLYKAGINSEITQLEMELQAEIDKFVLLSLFIEANVDKVEVLEMLFENYYLFENLTPEEIQRYETAAGLAKKYCYALSKIFKKTDASRLIKELRYFYPLSHQQKIRHIMQ